MSAPSVVAPAAKPLSYDSDGGGDSDSSAEFSITEGAGAAEQIVAEQVGK